MDTLRIRPCRPSDLRALEWDDGLRAHRAILAEALASPGSVFFVAVADGAPVAQALANLDKVPGEPELWAVRVRPDLRGRGVGSRVLRALEEELRARGFTRARIAVEPGNAGARRLYERLGYEEAELVREAWSYVDPEGVTVRRESTLLVLRKELAQLPSSDIARRYPPSVPTST